MKPFLKSVAEYTYLNFKENLQSLAIVFPNKRARVFYNKYLSEITEKPVFAPKYYTITEYIQSLTQTQIADPITLLFELYEVYISVTESKEKFDDFLFYCEMLLADFDDIDKYLVDAEMLFTNLADIKEIESYFQYLEESQIETIKNFWDAFISNRESNEKKEFRKLWDVLHKIYIGYKGRLESKNLAYEGMAYRKVISCIEKDKLKIREQKILFVGFNALNKCETRLFHFLQSKQKAIFFWDFDNFYLEKGEYHEAAYFLKHLIKKFPSPAGFIFKTELIKPEKIIHIYDITTQTGQTKAIHMALSDAEINIKENPEKTAIALADESLLLPLLNAIPSDLSEVNISMGYPLNQTQAYSLIGILIGLQSNKRKEKNGDMFYHKDVFRILQNGLVTGFNSEVIDSTILHINKFNQIYVNSDDLANLNMLTGIIFKKGIEVNSFTGYLIEILEIVKNQNMPDNRIRIIESEAIFKILTQLRRIKDLLNKSHISLNLKSLARLIGKFLESATIPFSGEPLSGVQVMGILETRTLDFENLIILSMNEGIFPKSGNVPTFVPYSLRKAFGLPTIEHQDAIFAYYFYRLLQRSKNIHLFYTSSVSDNDSGEPSRFIQQLKYESKFNIHFKTIGYKIFPVETKKITYSKNENTRKYLLNKYAGENSSRLSPSAINTYLDCSLKFYFRYIAEIKEPEEIIEEAEGNILGNIIHKTMEELYKPIKNTEIIRADFDTIINDKEHIRNQITGSIYSEYLSPGKIFNPKEHIKFTGSNLLLYEVTYRYVMMILNHDKINTPAKITGLEEDCHYLFPLSDNIFIKVGGIIDRIDIKDNKLRIVDYKSGKIKDSFEALESLFYNDPTKRNGAALQILLYSLIQSKKSGSTKIEPALLFIKNIKNKNFDTKIKYGKTQSKAPVEDFGLLKDEFEHYFIECLEQIFASKGEYSQTNDQDFCSYCAYNQMCRR